MNNRILHLTSLFLILIMTACQQEQEDHSKSAQFEEGFPELLGSIKNNLPFDIISHATLNSENDSIAVLFGTLKQGETEGYWAALALNEQLQSFQSFSYNPEPENEKENDLDLKFNDLENRVSLRILEIDSTNSEVTYSWIGKTGVTDSLRLIEINSPLQAGRKLPALDLTKLNGEKLDLADYENQVLVINWWAVWCAPCRKEIPALNEIVRKYSKDSVKFIAVTNDSRENVEEYLQTNDFDYEITFVSEKDEVIFGNSYPKNIVTDNSGVISYYSEGASDLTPMAIEDNLLQQIEKL